MSKSQFKKENVFNIKYGAKTKTVEKSTVRKKQNNNKIPNNNPKSPIRFINKAFNAALLASILVNQKLINKYEHNPTPSQPKKSCIKLSPVTKINIKKVKSDKYDINLVK